VVAYQVVFRRGERGCFDQLGVGKVVQGKLPARPISASFVVRPPVAPRFGRLDVEELYVRVVENQRNASSRVVVKKVEEENVGKEHGVDWKEKHDEETMPALLEEGFRADDLIVGRHGGRLV